MIKNKNINFLKPQALSAVKVQHHERKNQKLRLWLSQRLFHYKFANYPTIKQRLLKDKSQYSKMFKNVSLFLYKAFNH